MGNFRVLSDTPENSEPSVVGDYSLFLPNRTDKVLTSAMFTTLTSPQYLDPEGDIPTFIKILSLPLDGTVLLYNGIPVTLNQEISIVDIDAGLLTYDAPDQDNLASNSFNFTVKSENNDNYSQDTGRFLISSGKVSAPINRPPIVSNASEILTSETYEFKLIDFTTNFIDYDGDSYQMVTIESLPPIGTLTYNGQPVEVGFEFDLANVNLLEFNMPGNTIVSGGNYCEFDEDVADIIARYEADGFTLESKTNGILKFVKENINEIPNDTNIYAFFDATSMAVEDARAAKIALDAWYVDFVNTNPLFTGELYILPTYLENWLSYPKTIRRGAENFVIGPTEGNAFAEFTKLPPNFVSNSNTANPAWIPPPNAVVLAFVDEVENGTAEYHKNSGAGLSLQPYPQYFTDYKIFKSAFAEYDFFKGIFYPIPDVELTNYDNIYNGCVLQGFAAIEGGPVYTLPEIEALGVTFAEERHFDWHLNPNSPNYTGTDPQVANPYSEEAHTAVPGTAYELEPLKKYGWVGVYDKSQPAANVFSVQTFTDDLNKYLQGQSSSEAFVETIEGECYALLDMCFNFSTSDDSNQNLYSDTAQFCLGSTPTGTADTAPTVDSNSTPLRVKEYTFGIYSFTKNFNDPDGDSYGDLIIKSLPRLGDLYYNGSKLSVGSTLGINYTPLMTYVLQDNYSIYNGVVYDFGQPVQNIVTSYETAGYKLTSNIDGKMTFSKSSGEVVITGILVSSKISFDFIVTDNSITKRQSNLSTFTFTTEGNINVASTDENQPPIVGDNTINVEYNQIRTLVRQDFVDDTDPRFSDPEGDQPYQLKVLSLPSSGLLLLRGSPVVVGQILNFINDIDAREFKFDPDDNLEYFYELSFDFTISDTGSKKFAQ